MATIKSYTDISQSKKLAEILPLESADMHFINDKNAGCVPYLEITNSTNPWLKGTNISPCWSLVALYHILPNTEHISTTLSRGGWKIEPPEYVDTWWCEYEDENDHTRDVTVEADNPVDACYEMVLRLHERKML